MSVFKKLSEINVSDKTEKKGNQKYLSWSHAWSMAKEHYPSIQRTVYEDSLTGLNYFNDGKSGYVKVGITIEGLEHIDYLPIMDFRNQSINIDKITSMDVNKTIQRSTTKAIALHGLGIALYSGEDLIDTAKTTKPTAPATKVALNVGDGNWDNVVKYVVANKNVGLASLVKNLEVKYSLTTAVKKELSKHV
jgi:hypothetical protein